MAILKEVNRVCVHGRLTIRRSGRKLEVVVDGIVGVLVAALACLAFIVYVLN
jgi:hypothetical protein